MLGDPNQAYACLNRHLAQADFADKTRHETLLLAVKCMLHWVEADLPALTQAATRYLEISRKLKLPASMVVANFYQGIAHYQRNNLAAAEQSLAPAKGSLYKT